MPDDLPRRGESSGIRDRQFLFGCYQAFGVWHAFFMKKVLRSTDVSVYGEARAGMQQWRKVQVALSPGRKLELIGKLIMQTRQLESIKRHATRL